MDEVRFEGTFTALVTPMRSGDGSVDHAALEQLTEDQIAGGVRGLVPCGTTGESPTLTADEQVAVIERVCAVAAGRVPVVAGTGTFCTDKSIAASRAAVRAGADAVMIVMPYYSKPSQAGLSEHVLAIARAVRRPIVLYNIPGRSVVDLGADATEALCEAAAEVVAVKDATGNVLRCQELKRRLGDRLAVMCGDDALTLPMMAAGASGVISVTSNVLPAAVDEVVASMLRGDLEAARQAHFRLLPLHEALFAEPSPAPCKAALAHLGAMNDAVRLPMIAANEETRARLVATLDALGVHPGAAEC